MIPWEVPKIWAGETVFILGGGKSLQGMDLSPLKGRPTIGVNDAFRLGADICWFCDCRWYEWEWNKRDLQGFTGLIACATACPCENPLYCERPVYQLLRGQPTGIDPRPTHVAFNRNSGNSAINLAVHLGAKRIVLLGFDMKPGHWHDNHAHTPPDAVYQKLYLPPLYQVNHDLAELGVECLNATPGTALTVFPLVNLKEVA